MTLNIQIFENNQIIKTFKSVKTLEKYMRKHQLENGMPLKYKKLLIILLIILMRI